MKKIIIVVIVVIAGVFSLIHETTKPSDEKSPMTDQDYIRLAQKSIESYALIPSDSKPAVEDNGGIITVYWPTPRATNSHPTLGDDFAVKVKIDKKDNRVIRVIAPR